MRSAQKTPNKSKASVFFVSATVLKFKFKFCSWENIYPNHLEAIGYIVIKFKMAIVNHLVYHDAWLIVAIISMRMWQSCSYELDQVTQTCGDTLDTNTLTTSMCTCTISVAPHWYQSNYYHIWQTKRERQLCCEQCMRRWLQVLMMSPQCEGVTGMIVLPTHKWYA